MRMRGWVWTIPLGLTLVFRELQQRIRDIRQGPDGFLYLLTAENNGALMRRELFTEK